MKFATEDFSFKRSRGVVWVCDLSESSKHLNDNATANEIEEFLPRLHWLGRTVVEAAGGDFVKWTGDGFLAWFETPLHRELADRARDVVEAIWHLSATVNVTQLCVQSKRKFRLRHGVTFEQDALLTTIAHSDGHKSFDITGRGVVLAFRLSGVGAVFPGATIDATIAKALKQVPFQHVCFKGWIPSHDQLLRFFKGEKWGTRGLSVSVKCLKRNQLPETFVRNTRRLIASVEMAKEVPPCKLFSRNYSQAMVRGPKWAQEVFSKETDFILASLGTLKDLTEHFSKGDLAALSKIKINGLELFK